MLQKSGPHFRHIYQASCWVWKQYFTLYNWDLNTRHPIKGNTHTKLLSVHSLGVICLSKKNWHIRLLIKCHLNSGQFVHYSNGPMISPAIWIANILRWHFICEHSTGLLLTIQIPDKSAIQIPIVLSQKIGW